jgi:hypothetical protein
MAVDQLIYAGDAVFRAGNSFGCCYCERVPRYDSFELDREERLRTCCEKLHHITSTVNIKGATEAARSGFVCGQRTSTACSDGSSVRMHGAKQSILRAVHLYVWPAPTEG